MRCGDDNDDEEGGANSPEIAKVEKVYPDGRTSSMGIPSRSSERTTRI